MRKKKANLSSAGHRWPCCNHLDRFCSPRRGYPDAVSGGQLTIAAVKTLAASCPRSAASCDQYH